MVRAPGAEQDAEWSTYGEVFTRRWVVESLLDLTGYLAIEDLSILTLLEPSCGSGAFLIPAIERLLVSRARTGVPFAELGDCIRAYDLQNDHVEMARKLVVEALISDGCTQDDAEALATTWVIQGDFLLHEDVRLADVVIGNPPYIRLEDVPEDLAREYRSRWTTMTGRADIYVGFVERGLALLKPGGRLGFICADRWMRNQYGKSLRRLIGENYALQHVWTLHAVDAFEVDVSAYPAIVVLSHATQAGVTIAETTSEFDATSAASLTKWASGRDDAQTGMGYSAHRLPSWVSGDAPWPTGSGPRIAAIERLIHTFPPLEDTSTGTRISIGIATGADGIYITTDPDLVEANRLLPLTMTSDLVRDRAIWSGHYLVNPWGVDGKLVPLSDYPKLEQYLQQNKARLLERNVAKNNPATWYRTIDAVRVGLAERPKLLLQDMKAAITPVLETGGHYPHHNLYYVTSDTWDLEVLGGLLLSRVAQAFIEAYGVKMRGGTLRFQAQYLRQIRVPEQSNISSADRKALRTAFQKRDVNLADSVALRLYGMDYLPE